MFRNFLNEIGTHCYTASCLADLTNAELVNEINSLPYYDSDLCSELVERAFPDYSEPWEVGDAIMYKAAEKLGVEID